MDKQILTQALLIIGKMLMADDATRTTLYSELEAVLAPLPYIGTGPEDGST